MKKTILIAFFLYCTQLFAQVEEIKKVPVPAQKINRDAFVEMMKICGINTENLGFHPKGYWTRYPVPADIPYKILAFDDLFAHPQYIYDYVSVMGQAVEDFMHPEYMKKNRDAMYKISYYCGVSHLTAQFRGYSASLWAELENEEPLLNAIKDIYKITHTVFKYNRIEQAGEFPLIEKDLRKAIKIIHPEIRKEVARALINLTEAWRFQQIAMRNVDYKDAVACLRIRHLGETQFDGMEYYPCMENIAQSIDMNSMYYAGQKLMAIGEQLSRNIEKIREENPKIAWKEQKLNINTPLGRVIINAIGNDVNHHRDVLLLLDLGGNDVYHGAAGSASSLELPVSLYVDMDGNDQYLNEDEYLASQGAAVLGAGVLFDLKGNDVYKSKRLSQGAAMFGFGALVDMEGNDTYEMWTSGQGAAYFGIGLAIDNLGNDKYYIHGDGQGYGGVGGVGTLINRSGNDYYYGEMDTQVVFRSDYWHSHKGQHNYSYVQGAGVGRRGDVTDGHSWAGGIGTLIDLEGNDTYISGNWSQGCGYWYGTGILYDGAGDDIYQSTSWSQAAGAHFCIGVLIDEKGKDSYKMWEKQSQGMGFAHDYTIALFLDKEGDDSYFLHNEGLGYAINKSQVFFFDLAGNDTYTTGGFHKNYGYNNFENANPPGVELIYHLYSDQICFFADVEGNDTYSIQAFDDGKKAIADTLMHNGATLFFPDDLERTQLNSNRYYGLGKDFQNFRGEVPLIFTNKMKSKMKEEKTK
jgi:hypothetical protein